MRFGHHDIWQQRFAHTLVHSLFHSILHLQYEMYEMHILQDECCGGLAMRLRVHFLVRYSFLHYWAGLVYITSMRAVSSLNCDARGHIAPKGGTF